MTIIYINAEIYFITQKWQFRLFLCMDVYFFSLLPFWCKQQQTNGQQKIIIIKKNKLSRFMHLVCWWIGLEISYCRNNHIILLLLFINTSGMTIFWLGGNGCAKTPSGRFEIVILLLCFDYTSWYRWQKLHTKNMNALSQPLWKQ